MTASPSTSIRPHQPGRDHRRRPLRLGGGTGGVRLSHHRRDYRQVIWRTAAGSYSAAVRAASCRSVWTAGACAVSNIRWVSTITARSRSGWTRNEVPSPPSHPNAPAHGPSSTTDGQAPSRARRGTPYRTRAARRSAVVGHVAHLVRGQHRIAAAQQHPRERQQVVRRRHQPGGAVVERRRPAPLAVRRVPDLSPSAVGWYAVASRATSSV